MIFFIDDVVAGLLAFFQLFAALKLRDDCVRLIILVGRFFRRARDDQRRASFINQDRIYFVDHGKIMIALYAGSEIELHIVAQIIEAEFIVGTVSDVGGVGCLTLEVIHVILDAA